MSDKHKSILLEGNAAISSGNNDGFLKHCSEDTVWNFLGDRILRGKEEVRQYMLETYVEPPHVIVDHLIADGDLLTAVGEIRMKDDNGKLIAYDYCDVWTFRHDKLTELKAFVIRK